MDVMASPISYKRARNFSFSYNPNLGTEEHQLQQLHQLQQHQQTQHAMKDNMSTVTGAGAGAGAGGTSSQLSRQIEEQTLFLPRLHPKNICTQGVPSKTIHVKKNKYKKKRLYSRLKHFEALAEEINDPGKQYEGAYVNGYVTPTERMKLEEQENKKKCLAGMFKLHSGVASAIPLRKEGVVRTQGQYFNRVEDVMYNREKPCLLEGPWRPAQVSVSPIKKPHKLAPIGGD